MRKNFVIFFFLFIRFFGHLYPVAKKYFITKKTIFAALKSNSMKICVVGATGLVGSEMVKVLGEFDLGTIEFYPVASERSAGKMVSFRGKEYPVIGMQEAVDKKAQIAIFSAGAAASRQWAPIFTAAGTTVIDNSSAWRQEKDIPLIVPEINAGILDSTHKIISNPNCSTIQMVLVLAPLHRKYGIKRVVVSTYQSVTGSGAKGLLQLENERKGIEGPLFYPHQIDLNVIPHGGDFLAGDYTSEEIKLDFETRKIIGDDSIRVTATVVRVPVYGGHSESVNVEFEQPFEVEEVRDLLSKEEGIVIQDDPANAVYPMPLYSRGRNEVFAGRIRRDHTVPNGLNLWIVSDNLRKGAATNAVQIAKYLIEKKLVTSN
jgi:aspartate-semialdehyde dehydrogenase